MTVLIPGVRRYSFTRSTYAPCNLNCVSAADPPVAEDEDGMGGPPPPDTEAPIATGQRRRRRCRWCRPRCRRGCQLGVNGGVRASVAQVATLAEASQVRRRKVWTTLDSLLATRDSVQPDGPWGSYTVAVESTLVEGERGGRADVHRA
jgi:hypothetical protein